MHVLLVAGARPNFMKIAPVVRERAATRPSGLFFVAALSIESTVCVGFIVEIDFHDV